MQLSKVDVQATCYASIWSQAVQQLSKLYAVATMPFPVTAKLNDQLRYIVEGFQASVNQCRQPWWRKLPKMLMTLLMPFVALQILPAQTHTKSPAKPYLDIP